MVFDNLDQANKEYAALEQKLKEATTGFESLTKERDEALTNLTTANEQITMHTQKLEEITNQVSEKDASIQALQEKITSSEEQLSKISTDYVPKETHDNLHTSYTESLKASLKGHNLSDGLLENKTIDQLQAMLESVAAIKPSGAQPAAGSVGMGFGGGGSQTHRGAITPQEHALQMIEEAKKR